MLCCFDTSEDTDYSKFSFSKIKLHDRIDRPGNQSMHILIMRVRD